MMCLMSAISPRHTLAYSSTSFYRMLLVAALLSATLAMHLKFKVDGVVKNDEARRNSDRASAWACVCVHMSRARTFALAWENKNLSAKRSTENAGDEMTESSESC